MSQCSLSSDLLHAGAVSAPLLKDLSCNTRMCESMWSVWGGDWYGSDLNKDVCGRDGGCWTLGGVGASCRSGCGLWSALPTGCLAGINMEGGEERVTATRHGAMTGVCQREKGSGEPGREGNHGLYERHRGRSYTKDMDLPNQVQMSSESQGAQG
eukprot:359636-Chlamydomonas_euryale.AAC.6